MQAVGRQPQRAQGAAPVHCAHHRPVRLSWAKLLKCVFDLDLDLEPCPNCGGERSAQKLS